MHYIRNITLLQIWWNFRVNIVECLKNIVANRNPEGVLDPKLPERTTSRALKRSLLVALYSVDPNARKWPKMGQVIHILEAEDTRPPHSKKYAFNSAQNSFQIQRYTISKTKLKLKRLMR